MIEFPSVQVKSATESLVEAVNTQSKSIHSLALGMNAMNARLDLVSDQADRAERQRGLWIFAAGGYVTGLAGLLLAVLT